MQAITIKYIPATDTQGTRLKAECARGSITIDHPHNDNPIETALKALLVKFLKEDLIEYGRAHDSAWRGPWRIGQAKNGDYVAVCTKPTDYIRIDCIGDKYL